MANIIKAVTHLRAQEQARSHIMEHKPIAPPHLSNQRSYSGSISQLGTEDVSTDVLLRAYRGTCWSVINAISQAVGQIDFAGYKKEANGKDSPLPLNNRLGRLLYEPNPHTSSDETWGNAASWNCITGNSYLWIGRNSYGEPVELWGLQSNMVRVEAGDLSIGEPFVNGYRYGAGNDGELIPAEDIIHFKLNSLRNPYYGESPMQAAWRTMQTESEMEEAVYSYFKNGGLVALFTKVNNPPLDEDEWEMMKEDFRRQFTGAKMAGRPVILGPDWGDLQSVSPDAQKTLMVEYQDAISLKIHNIFRVPRLITGDVQDFNRANSITAERVFYKTTVSPMGRLIANGLTRKLSSSFEENGVLPIVSFSDITPLDREELASISDTLAKTKVFSPDQILELNNFPKLEGLYGGSKPMYQIEFDQSMEKAAIPKYPVKPPTTDAEAAEQLSGIEITADGIRQMLQLKASMNGHK